LIQNEKLLVGVVGVIAVLILIAAPGMIGEAVEFTT
jgi:hypothetical protein